MRKSTIIAICTLALLVLQADPHAQDNQYDLRDYDRAYNLKSNGGVLLGFGVAGTVAGVTLVIVGNTMKNANGPGYYSSYQAAEDAHSKWETGGRLITIGGFGYGIGIPMIIGGAIMRGVANSKLKRYKRLERASIQAGSNYVKLVYDF